ncbi:MAG: dihydrodipicolinate synthase family protein, partial [Alphaproteobacteria bacterium]
MLKDLRGVIPPISTPFDADGNVVHSALAEIVEFQIAAGVHGLIPGGSTGEGHTFEREDFLRMFETVAKTNRGRLPLLAGLIVNSTQEAIIRGRMVRDLGAQGLQVTPV